MAAQNISIYTSVKETKSNNTIGIDLFFDGIKNGKWQDIVLPLRAIADKDQRTKAKLKSPCVTISGIFNERTDAGLKEHSGLIPIDIDEIDIINVKNTLLNDPYVYALFDSISGRGLCAIFKINPSKHRESFQGISEYLFTSYKIICDPTSINVSRARFISYDPYLYENDNALKFTSYPKNKEPSKVEKILYVQSDFDEIINEITRRNLNICDNYHEWIRIAFGLCHKFGEGGRQYFHLISQHSAKYDNVTADRQYTACLKHKGQKQSTIATVYYYCKQTGIQVYSERTKKIAYSASHGKKGGISAEQVAINLQKFEDISDSLEVVKQVFENNIEIKGEDSLLEQLELWVRQNYELKRNEITLYIENNGKPLKQKDFNTIFIKAKKIFEKLPFEYVDRLINSDFVDTYNPFFQFFEDHKDCSRSGNIESLFNTIESKDMAFLQHFGKKWLVGIISAIHGEHSPLMLVLCGAEQGTGKSEYFRRLLPKDLQKYMADSKLDAGKDDEILMTQKILIMDDEMGGKSKKESKRLKELTSKQVFSLREPYGRNNVDLTRLAVLCGTTNDSEILNDQTGNRRIIPVSVTSINQDAYNRVNKVELFMEAYRLWKSGFDWRVSRSEIAYLNKDALEFEVTSIEGELINKYFEPADPTLNLGDYMTCTDMKVYIEIRSQQKLSPDKLGRELKKHGFIQQYIRFEGVQKRLYRVYKKLE